MDDDLVDGEDIDRPVMPQGSFTPILREIRKRFWIFELPIDFDIDTFLSRLTSGMVFLCFLYSGVYIF